MVYLIVVGGAAALVHLALTALVRGRVAEPSRPAWLAIAWPASSIVVATVAIVASATSPTNILGAVDVLWVVPALDTIVAVTALAVLPGRPPSTVRAARAEAPEPARRRMLAGVVALAAVATGCTPRPEAAAGGTTVGSGPPQADPLANGVVGDYSGRFRMPGTGTDSRTGIQAALDAASDVVGTGYYSYTSRRSTAVTLPPGHYLISAPDQDASLVIPPGVVLDASAATLYFDYPAPPRASWCGIRVGQYGQLQLGKLYPSDRFAPPDGELVYDAVRLVQSDDNTRVVGYGDSEIRGWRGAAIRGVGAWIVYIKGLRVTDCAYGYVASRTGDGTLGYTVARADNVQTRNHTDLRIQDCSFVNLSHGGLIGAVRGDAGRLLEPDFDSLSLTVGLVGCVFENINGYALDISSAMVVGAWDCAFEEVGAAGQGMVRLDNCRAASFLGTRVNLAGRTDAAAPGGRTDAAAPGRSRLGPAYVFQVAATESIVIDGMHAYNSLNPALQLADAEPSVSWRVGNVSARSALAPGPMYVSEGSTGLSGRWDGGHLVLGSRHLWVDAAGSLRHKNGPPAGETDGTVIS